MSLNLAAHPSVGLIALLYALSLFASLPSSWRNQAWRRNPGAWLLVLAGLANTLLIAWNWIDYGRPPFKTLFETMVFYPLCVSLVTVFVLWQHRLFLLVPCAAGICLAGLVYALYRPDLEVVNLPPALQSAWFVPHVVTYFISYAALFLSAVLALGALLRKRGRGTQAEALASHAHHTAIFGTVTLTLGLIMGGVWGKYAWGDYWSWDPKENWALVTWLAYITYLHLRRIPGWQGRKGMAVLVLAFAAVVFTYLGMNLLPGSGSSLHVYQG